MQSQGGNSTDPRRRKSAPAPNEEVGENHVQGETDRDRFVKTDGPALDAEVEMVVLQFSRRENSQDKKFIGTQLQSDSGRWRGSVGHRGRALFCVSVAEGCV